MAAGRCDPLPRADSKSRYGRREVPIPVELADRLRAHVAGRGEEELVFRSTVGTILDSDNLAERVLAPACAEAGVEWAGFHTFRHTVASRLFAEGRSVVQVQRWLGHHKPSFTLDTYIHLLPGDVVEPLGAAMNPAMHATGTDDTPPEPIRSEPPETLTITG